MPDKLADLFSRVVDHAIGARDSAASRPHRPELDYAQMLARFDAPTPEAGAAGADVIADLIEKATPGLAAMTGPRFFGWVIGGSHPVGVAADWLTSAWGQNAANAIATPAASAVEEISARWLLDILDLPREASVGFVSGATIATFTCLAAARSEVLRRAGWDPEADGVFGAPEVTVVIGEDAHSTVFQALKYLGFGDTRLSRVAVDDQGRIVASEFRRALRDARGPKIAIAQAGHIISGAFDPLAEIASASQEAGAWLHIDGAFGLWARAASDRAHLAEGIELADSWATDGHKWLQTPYDCGYAIVRDAAAHRRAMGMTASYLPTVNDRNPSDLTPELSRRARGFATWAMIRALGRKGIAEMVSRHCAQAQRLADKLAAEPGVEIVHDVVLNMVAARFGTDLDEDTADRLTRAAIERIQAKGDCFVGGATWRGRQLIRASVINYGTTDADIDKSAAAILDGWRAAVQAGE
ncbi:MAG: aminotransferase class V-fold PLP-dependent enzyme [Alphaproteobacteria bacterium]|nr:aminotransferase class V-fold PLP-dependent enzyme [Alphaproteobacteria bacterium]